MYVHTALEPNPKGQKPANYTWQSSVIKAFLLQITANSSHQARESTEFFPSPNWPFCCESARERSVLGNTDSEFFQDAAPGSFAPPIQSCISKLR
jgi:hypothetical protein